MALSTCNSCHRRDYCGNCKHKDDCWWLRVAPPDDVNRCFSCGAFECAHYDDCRKQRPKDRVTRELKGQIYERIKIRRREAQARLGAALVALTRKETGEDDD